jgi:serine/threonine protein phosphatase PrpC
MAVNALSKNHKTATETAEILVKAALDANSVDNITVIVVVFSSDL